MKPYQVMQHTATLLNRNWSSTAKQGHDEKIARVQLNFHVHCAVIKLR